MFCVSSKFGVKSIFNIRGPCLDHVEDILFIASSIRGSVVVVDSCSHILEVCIYTLVHDH
jgi:hypothetical protein